MKETKTKLKFLELRAKGKSFRTIEKEIGTGRRTLARWESECEHELKNMQAIELEALREEYLLTKQARLELLGG